MGGCTPSPHNHRQSGEATLRNAGHCQRGTQPCQELQGPSCSRDGPSKAASSSTPAATSSGSIAAVPPITAACITVMLPGPTRCRFLLHNGAAGERNVFSAWLGVAAGGRRRPGRGLTCGWPFKQAGNHAAVAGQACLKQRSGPGCGHASRGGRHVGGGRRRACGTAGGEPVSSWVCDQTDACRCRCRAGWCQHHRQRADLVEARPA